MSGAGGEGGGERDLMTGREAWGAFSRAGTPSPSLVPRRGSILLGRLTHTPCPLSCVTPGLPGPRKIMRVRRCLWCVFLEEPMASQP